MRVCVCVWFYAVISTCQFLLPSHHSEDRPSVSPQASPSRCSLRVTPCALATVNLFSSATPSFQECYTNAITGHDLSTLPFSVIPLQVVQRPGASIEAPEAIVGLCLHQKPPTSIFGKESLIFPASR